MGADILVQVAAGLALALLGWYARHKQLLGPFPKSGPAPVPASPLPNGHPLLDPLRRAADAIVEQELRAFLEQLARGERRPADVKESQDDRVAG